MRAPLVVVVLVLLGLVSDAVQAGDPPADPPGWTLLPGTPLFAPLPASPEEPRAGLRKEIGNPRMRLDIGTTFDVLSYTPAGDSASSFSIGTDLFTYALITSIQGLKLQVDAVDGYFSAHIVHRQRHGASSTYARLRVIHLSSHFIDGHFRLETETWLNGQLPRPYSRDAVELTAAYAWGDDDAAVMLYAGFSQAWFVRPAAMRRFNTFQGVAAHTAEWIGPLWGRPVHVYIADHFLLAGVGTLEGTNVLEAGVKIGSWHGHGVRLFLSVHAGAEIFHQYYDSKRTDVGLGFALDVR